MRCPVCEGSGYVHTFSDSQECSFCNRSGEIPATMDELDRKIDALHGEIVELKGLVIEWSSRGE